jgi:hypothetical protein
MSRSIVSRHNKNAVIMKFWGGDSDKKDKQKANRSFRRSNKMDAKKSTLVKDDEFKYHDIREISDTWSFRSDGLSHYWNISDYEKEEFNKLKSK